MGAYSYQSWYYLINEKLICDYKKKILFIYSFIYIFFKVWFAASLVLAVLIPDIGQVIQILGSLAAVFIFVFPGNFKNI